MTPKGIRGRCAAACLLPPPAAAGACCRRRPAVHHHDAGTCRPSQATTGEAFSIALAIYAAVCLGLLLAFTW